MIVANDQRNHDYTICGGHTIWVVRNYPTIVVNLMAAKVLFSDRFANQRQVVVPKASTSQEYTVLSLDDIGVGKGWTTHLKRTRSMCGPIVGQKTRKM